MRYYAESLILFIFLAAPSGVQGAKTVLEPDQTQGTVGQPLPFSSFIEEGLVARLVIEPPNGGWNGIAIADLSQVPGRNRPAAFIVSGSGGSYRRAIDPRSGQAISSESLSPVLQDRRLNIQILVAVVGRYIVFD